MGCWNGSCALTGLPVFYNEDVYVMLLVRQPASMDGDKCEPNGFWSPLVYHFTGKYDDYGKVDECEGKMLPHIVNTLRDNLFEFEQGENKYHDIPVKAEEFNLEKMFEADHEDRLAITSKWKTDGEGENRKLATQQVQHVIIRKEIMDSLLTDYRIDSYRFGEISYDAIVANGKELIADIQAAAENVSDDIAEMLKDVPEEKRARMIRALLFGDFRNIPKYHLINMIEHAIRYADLFYPSLDLIDVIDAGNIEMANEIIHQIAVAIIVNDYMGSARRQWTPMSGAGSQDDSTYAQRFMAQLTIAAADKIDKRWEEDEE